MKPFFDDNGLAISPGEIRCFYYDSVTSEYAGWSDEYIHVGVSMPGFSTEIEPVNKVPGEVAIFTGSGWWQEEDHRGDKVYSTASGAELTVDYIGAIKEGYTYIAPSTPYDKWDGERWVTDTDARRVADIAAADAEKQGKIEQANYYINSKQWPGKAALGRLKDSEKNQYILWLDYLDALYAVDSGVPEWPAIPVT